ncbi:MAG: cytochrome c biogenesis protein CcsA [Magnetococcales bacterium]|nr:cytochrome c biogenesis protein CcsA [Magnetococcales bacterium]
MDRLARFQRWTGWLTLLLLGVALTLAVNAPADFQQSNSVRILFVHVPSAKMSLLMYVAVTVCSIWVLVRRSETADILAAAAVPVGAAFAAVTLATGSIWGKPMWGTWWAWDARLTSMLVLLIIYVGLMALRSALDDPQKSARATAVMAIVGAVDLPIIHFSVTWWRTLHQPPSIAGPGTGKIHIAGPLLTPLIAMAIAFIALGAYMWFVNARLIRASRRLEQLDTEHEEHG